MPEPVALTIALRSGAICLAGIAAVALAAALVKAWRAGKAPDLRGPIAGSLVMAVPVAFAVWVAMAASVVLIGLGVPPLAYLFVGAAAGLAFAGGWRRSAYGMEGCARLLQLSLSAYAVVWSGMSFVLLGGPGALAIDLPGLAAARPLLVALPYAGAVVALTAARPGRAERFLGTLVVLAALFAFAFLPVERVLPGAGWVRFPLAAVALAVGLVGLHALMTSLLSRHRRAAVLRGAPLNAFRVALLLLPAGLSWAGAFALTGA
jgi:hypothetical protein